MIRLLISLLLFFPVIAWSSCVETTTDSGVWEPDTGSRADVELCISDGGWNSGDKIEIPAGAWTWDSPLIFTSGVRIQGAGDGATAADTIITNSCPLLFLGSPFTMDIDDPDTFEISDIRIVADTVANEPSRSYMIEIQGSAVDWRIHDMTFYNAYSGSIKIGKRFSIWGLIDHNDFLQTVTAEGNAINIGISGNQFDDWYVANSENYSWGSAHAIYVEDNLFRHDQDQDSITQHSSGGRSVFRHNMIQGAVLDIHDYCTALNEGGLYSEVYNNTFYHDGSFADKPTAVSVRGGSALVYNNQISGYGAANDGGMMKTYYSRTCRETYNTTEVYCPDTSRCDGNYNGALLGFDAGTDEYILGETVTGLTSGATGVVIEIIIESGTWLGNDAAGYISLMDRNFATNFSDNELITSSAGSATYAYTAYRKGIESYQDGNEAMVNGSGINTGATSATVLTDSTKSALWTADEFVGYFIWNTDAGSIGRIISNTTTTVTVAALYGGSVQEFTNLANYKISNGYPCFTQPGRGQDQVSNPIYEWNNCNNGQAGECTPGDTDDVDFYNTMGSVCIEPNPDYPMPAPPDHMQEGRDWMEDTELTYTAYTYPHPLIPTACRGASPAWESLSCEEEDIQNCLDQPTLVDGDTINVPAGNCEWTADVIIRNDISLIGAGIDVTTVYNDFTDGGLENEYILNFGANTVDISGFTFREMYVKGYGRDFRVHGNKFYRETADDGTTGVEWSPQAYIPGNRPQGLIDHNQFHNGRVVVYGGSYDYDDGNNSSNESWAIETVMATNIDTVYIEDNVYTRDTPTIGNAVDGNVGGQYVFRYNTLFGTYVEAHSMQGENRSHKKAVVYGNIIERGVASPWQAVHIRGGSGLVFNNAFMGNWYNGYVGIDNKRTDDHQDGVGICRGSHPMDGNTSGGGDNGDEGLATGGSNTTLINSGALWATNEWTGFYVHNTSEGILAKCVGLVTGNDGTTLTVDSGLGSMGTHQFLRNSTAYDNYAYLLNLGESWLTDEFIGTTLYNITDGSSCSVTSNTSTAVYCTLAGGTNNAWNPEDVYLLDSCSGNSAFDDGEMYVVTNGYPCRDQVGSGYDTTEWYPRPFGINTQTRQPFYTWSNTCDTSTNPECESSNLTITVWNEYDVTPGHMQADRDFYEYNTVFTGTSGVGCGPSNLRPITCDVGVAYWETLQSCTDMTDFAGADHTEDIAGTLFTCTEENVWTPYFIPYTYPHPLGDPAAVATAINFGRGWTLSRGTIQ